MKEGVERLFPVQKEAFCLRQIWLFPAKRALFCTPAGQKISVRALIPLAVSFANTIMKRWSSRTCPCAVGAQAEHVQTGVAVELIRRVGPPAVVVARVVVVRPKVRELLSP